jgi:hypothetical protein
MSLVGLATPDEGHGDNMGVTVFRLSEFRLFRGVSRSVFRLEDLCSDL